MERAGIWPGGVGIVLRPRVWLDQEELQQPLGKAPGEGLEPQPGECDEDLGARNGIELLGTIRICSFFDQTFSTRLRTWDLGKLGFEGVPAHGRCPYP